MSPDLEALLRRFLDDGDLGAMEELVRRTRTRLLRAARRIGAAQDAEDSVQTAYHALLRRAVRPLDAPVLPWLLTTVVRVAYRKKAVAARQRAVAERLAVERPEGSVDGDASTREHAVLVRQEVARLPAHYRDALVLHYFEGLTTQEVARLLDVPQPTVKARLQRGRRLLKGRLPSALVPVAAFLFVLFDQSRAAAATVGAAMQAKHATAAVLVLALALTAGSFLLLRGDRADAPRDAAARAGVAAAPAPPIDAAPEAPELPLPVDFTRVDLDRDLHGLVVDGDGAPVAGARVRAVFYPWRRTETLNVAGIGEAEDGPETRSASDGTFRLRLARGANAALRVEAAGYAAVELYDRQAGERVTVTLFGGAALRVRVLDPQGAPVPEVALRLFGREHLRVEREAVTDADGRAAFGGLSPRALLWLEPHHELGFPGWESVTMPAAGDHEVTVRLGGGRVVRGQVTDRETGAPIEGARVAAGWVMRRPVVTDREGRYELRGVRANAEIAVDAAGYGQDIAAAADEVDFALRPGTAVSGRVLGGAGAPVPGARVGAVGSRHEGDRQITSKRFGVAGADGRFRLAGLRPDLVHALTVTAPGHGRVMLDFDAAADVDVGDVVLPAPRAIEGSVVDADGRPVARASATLDGANDDRFRLLDHAPAVDENRYGRLESRSTDHLGRFRFPDLAPGTYTVSVRAPGRAPLQREVVLRDADVRDIAFRLPDARAFTIEAVTEDGAPIAGAFLGVRNAGGAIGGKTDADGRAVVYVQGVVESVSVYAPFGDRTLIAPPAERNVGEDVTSARFVFRRAGVIEGRVVAPDGTPVAGAWLEAQRDGNGLSSTFADDEGAFVLRVPDDGAVDVVFQGLRRGQDLRTETPYAGEIRGLSAGRREVVFRLRAVPVATIRIAVHDPDGAPVAGMSVYLGGPFADEVRAVTGADGSAVLAGVPEDRSFTVAFGGVEGRPEALWPMRRVVKPRTEELTVVSRLGVARRGRVTRGDKPVVGVLVRVAYQGAHTLTEVRTDDDGRFTVHVPRDPTDVVIVVTNGRAAFGGVQLALAPPGDLDIAVSSRD